jgi:multiple sugar transport system ATP-binding protein
MAHIKLDQITKEYGDVVAVDDIDIDIREGEFATLVGPSGCGKSTTLETVAGLTTPTSGTVSIDDTDVTDAPPKDRDIAMVFQNIALFPHMDVHDNISYGLRLRDFDKEEIDRRVEQAVEILQLEGMLDRQPDELSGGQRQRVAIGRAIVRQPKAFLMDEPLASLDAKLRNHMRTEIHRIQRELGIMTMYVTHDQEEAMTMSDRIIVMNEGEVQQFAPPMECYNEPNNQFVAGFLGSPPMNFFEGTATTDGIDVQHFDVQADLASIDIAGDDVTLGVRPENIHPTDTFDETRSTAPIEAYVDVFEPLGDTLLAYLVFEDPDERSAGSGFNDEETLTMNLDPTTDLEEGSATEIVLDRSAVHLFDAQGETLTHELASPKPARTESEPSSSPP